jgi:hypothetical protein
LATYSHKNPAALAARNFLFLIVTFPPQTSIRTPPRFFFCAHLSLHYRLKATMNREPILVRVVGTGLNDSLPFLTVAGTGSISSIQKSKAKGCIINTVNAQQFTRIDGEIATSLGTISVILELGGEQPVIDGTGVRTITVEFNVMEDKDMTFDAILASNVMRDLTQKYGKVQSTT